MKSPFIFFACLFLILPVSAVTMSGNIRFNDTIPAGSGASFDILFSKDISEDSVNFEDISISGDCSPWVSLNRTELTANESAAVHADISVPADVANGPHRCDISFSMPPSGMVQQVIGFPITVNVTSGAEPTPTATTAAPTATATAIPTTELPRTTYADASPLLGIMALAGLAALWRRM